MVEDEGKTIYKIGKWIKMCISTEVTTRDNEDAKRITLNSYRCFRKGAMWDWKVKIYLTLQ